MNTNTRTITPAAVLRLVDAYFDRCDIFVGGTADLIAHVAEEAGIVLPAHVAAKATAALDARRTILTHDHADRSVA